MTEEDKPGSSDTTIAPAWWVVIGVVGSVATALIFGAISGFETKWVVLGAVSGPGLAWLGMWVSVEDYREKKARQARGEPGTPWERAAERRAAYAARPRSNSSARQAALSRDGYSCVECGAAAQEVDHIVPRAMGGEDDVWNLQSLCTSCHRMKTSREAGMIRRYMRGD